MLFFLPENCQISPLLTLLCLPPPSSSSPSLCSSSLLGSWSTRSCRAVPVHSFRTKCVCDSLSTFAILARVNFDSVSHLSPSHCRLHSVRGFFCLFFRPLHPCACCFLRVDAVRWEHGVVLARALQQRSLCLRAGAAACLWILKAQQHVDEHKLDFCFQINEFHLDMSVYLKGLIDWRLAAHD